MMKYTSHFWCFVPISVSTVRSSSNFDELCILHNVKCFLWSVMATFQSGNTAVDETSFEINHQHVSTFRNSFAIHLQQNVVSALLSKDVWWLALTDAQQSVYPFYSVPCRIILISWSEKLRKQLNKLESTLIWKLKFQMEEQNTR